MQLRVEHAILNRAFGEVRTAIVLGVGRGGTSVVAGCLRGLGICMGNNPHPLKHEWSPLVYRSDGELDLLASRRSIARMDELYDRWGWKSPRDVFQLEQVLPFLRDPGFVFVTRDIFEASLSGLRYQDVPFYLGLNDTALVYHAITRRLRTWPWPVLIVPFSQALRQPESFVDLLASFMSFTPPEGAREQAISFIRPGRNAYRQFDAQPDDPPTSISARELRSDSEILAADFSQRQISEYFQQFERALRETKRLAARMGSRLPRIKERELEQNLSRILAILSEQNFRIARKAPLDSAFGRLAAADFPTTLHSVLRRLAGSAEEAKHHGENRAAGTGYEALNRLYQITQVMIRIRYLLQGAVSADELASAEEAGNGKAPEPQRPVAASRQSWL